MKCSGCSSSTLDRLFSFGNQPVAGYLVDSKNEALKAPKFDNTICICSKCKLVQQMDYSAHDILIKKVYSTYQSTYSASSFLRNYLDKFLSEAINYSGITKGMRVIEIGSNDGCMLKKIRELGFCSVGFDPSAHQESEKVIKDYFSKKTAKKYVEEFGPVNLVVSRHTMEHVFDVSDFMKGLKLILTNNGVACIEVPYLYHQMNRNQFQSMAHQHNSFFTITSINNLCEIYGLTLKGYKFVDMDGGSIVLYIKKGKNSSRRDLDMMIPSIQFEDQIGMTRVEYYQSWHNNLESSIRHIRDFIMMYNDKNMGPIVCYGAGGKGQALLNMLGLGQNTIDMILDDTPGVGGKYVPGISTKVISAKDYRMYKGLLFITAPTHGEALIKNVEKNTHLAPNDVLFTTPFFHIS
jgi:hypothetical protein